MMNDRLVTPTGSQTCAQGLNILSGHCAQHRATGHINRQRQVAHNGDAGLSTRLHGLASRVVAGKRRVVHSLALPT
jgi:hypothetical protein